MVPVPDARRSLILTWLRESLGIVPEEFAPASADASFRRYFRARRGGETLIVMDAPPDKEDVGPYLHVARLLDGLGVHVPKVLARDAERGFLLLSDLGNGQFGRREPGAQLRELEPRQLLVEEVLRGLRRHRAGCGALLGVRALVVGFLLHERAGDALAGGKPVRRLPARPRRRALEPIDNTDSVAEPEFDRMALRERMELVKPLLKKLSSSEKRVIELCYNGGLNFREVADLMGVTRSAIKGTHARALRKIRNILLSMHRLYE